MAVAIRKSQLSYGALRMKAKLTGSIDSLEDGSLGRAMFLQQNHALARFTGEAQRIAERCAFHDLIRLLIMAGQFDSDRKVCTIFDQELRNGKSPIIKLAHRVEDRRLAANSSLIDCCSGIHISAAAQKQL